MDIKNLKVKLTHSANKGIGLTLSGKLVKNIPSHSLRIFLEGKFHDSSSQTGYGKASWDFNISGRLTDDNFLSSSSYDYPYLPSAPYTGNTGAGTFRLTSFSKIGRGGGWGEPPKPNSKSYMQVIIDEVHYDDIGADWYNSDNGFIINPINQQPTYSDTNYRNLQAQLKLKEAGIDIAKLSSQISTSLQKLGYNPYQEKAVKDDSIEEIKHPNKFKQSKADKITNFTPSTDTLEIDTDSFGIDSSATFAAGKNKKTVKKKLAKQDFDFLYDKKKGGLYFNENGSDKGLGDGGIIAIFKGTPDLNASNLDWI